LAKVPQVYLLNLTQSLSIVTIDSKLVLRVYNRQITGEMSDSEFGR
jgi:hypothetical protein